jgi:two-component system OmpR family response regulator
MAHILLVEDDPGLGKGLKVALELSAYEVTWVESVHEAERALAKVTFDLVLLDLNLPDGSGLRIAKLCQKDQPQLPVIILTASSDEDSVVAGLEAGAGDYVRKPFGNKELLARVKVALRGRGEAQDKVLQYGGVKLVPEKRRVLINDQPVELNRREYDILAHFVAQPESVVTRESLLRVLKKEGEIFDRTIDSHISHLRTRLKQGGAADVQIISIYGVGYRLEKKA